MSTDHNSRKAREMLTAIVADVSTVLEKRRIKSAKQKNVTTVSAMATTRMTKTTICSYEIPCQRLILYVQEGEDAYVQPKVSKWVSQHHTNKRMAMNANPDCHHLISLPFPSIHPRSFISVSDLLNVSLNLRLLLRASTYCSD